MALCENKEELPPPSKATLCGDEITKAQSPEKEHTPHTAHREPEPSCMSVMSNQSNERYIDFKQGAQETKIRQRKKSPKPEPVCVSTMTSSSNERYIDFKQAPVETRGHQIPDTSKPGPSCVSMMSDQSNERHIDFKQGAQGTKIRQRKKSPKPEPVCVSTMSSSSNERHIDFSRATENSQNLPANEGWFSFMKNWIMDVIMNFFQRLFGKQLQQIPASTEPDSSAPTTFDESVLYNSINELDSFNETLQQIPASTEPEPQLQPSFAPTLCNESVLHKSSDELDFKLLEDNIITFVKNELKKIQKILCPDNSESQMEEETLLGGEGEEQKKREALVKLTLHFLRTIKKDEWADRLQNKLFAPQCQRKLKSNLKKKFQCVFEGIAKAGHPTLLNQIYTELYITGNDFIYPDHADRFVDWCQLLCKDVLHGRCYWEVEWTGEVDISVSYRGIGRKGERKNCRFGENPQSWSLDCSNTRGYTVYHNQRISVIHPSSSSSPPCGSKRVAVYVDCPAGTVSFYNVSSDSLIHLHTFNTKFTEPLYPGFGVWHHSCGSSVRLCSVQVEESPSVRETV